MIFTILGAPDRTTSFDVWVECYLCKFVELDIGQAIDFFWRFSHRGTGAGS